MARPSYSTPLDQTQRQLRDLFDKWGVYASDWAVVRDGHEEEHEDRGRIRRRWVSHSPSVTVRYFRNSVWQSLFCSDYGTVGENLRAIFMLLDRLRISENAGVQYGALTSTTDLVPKGVGPSRREQLLAQLHLNKDAPFTVVEATWRRLVREASDAGDEDRMKQLNIAFNELKKELAA